MLVLSRKSGEKIHIGDDIAIEIRKVAGNRVSIGVLAPATKRILRGELLAGTPRAAPLTEARLEQGAPAVAQGAERTEAAPVMLHGRLSISSPTPVVG